MIRVIFPILDPYIIVFLLLLFIIVFLFLLFISMLLPYIIVNKDYHQRLTVLGLLFACWRIGLNSDGGGMVNMFAEISDLHCKHKILNARCLYRAY